jgi:CHAD domain-containing protein
MPLVAKARKIRGLEPDMPFAEAAGLTIALRADEVFVHADGVLDTADIERVHDMRVATRRLRAVLEIYEPCFPRRRYEAVLAEVKQLADALGERRDPDVHIDAMTRFAAGFATADRAGVAAFTATLREQQSAGNDAVAAALARAEKNHLHARLLAMARTAEDSVAA